MSIFARAPAFTRPLSAVDSAACAVMHAASFAKPWSSGEIERLILLGACGDGIGLRGSALAGFVLSRQAADEAEILTIAIDKTQRRHGLATKLLGVHFARLAAKGVSDLFLEVDEANVAARTLYNRFGFVEAGRREAYYIAPNGVRSAALIMRRAL